MGAGIARKVADALPPDATISGPETTAALQQAPNGRSGAAEVPAPVFIENAGLVLLHPFLPRLFAALGYVDPANKWVSTHVHRRAVLLLQYLADDAGGVAEPLLFLNKLLCGYPLEATLDAEFSPTEKEEEQCLRMLEATVQHWSVLKNTGVAALRETFLQRQGKLCMLENGWKLQVAQKPFDLLLAHLPWTISRIRTPWMGRWLLTEWT